jgi:hypothetical protein
MALPRGSVSAMRTTTSGTVRSALETGERFADVVQVLQAALRPFQFSNAVISPGDIGTSAPPRKEAVATCGCFLQAIAWCQCLVLGNVLDGFFQIANFLLHFAFQLLLQALCLLVLAAGQFTAFFLNLSGNVFRRALDLILVHVDLSSIIGLRIQSKPLGLNEAYQSNGKLARATRETLYAPILARIRR